MAAFRKIVAYSASIALLLNAVSFSAKAQTYETLIEQNPERAAGVYHYYEYSPSALTKAPKGYKRSTSATTEDTDRATTQARVCSKRLSKAWEPLRNQGF